MTDDQRLIIELTYLLGLALGALEVIKLSPHDFNPDGITFVTNELRRYTEPTITLGELDD